MLEKLIASIGADEGWGEVSDEERELVRERLEQYRKDPGGTIDWRPFIESLRSH